jgi:carboxyl-terminal processing protease
MDFVKGMFRLMVVSFLVASVAAVAFLVGFGSGYDAGAEAVPAPAKVAQATPAQGTATTTPRAAVEPDATPTPRPPTPMAASPTRTPGRATPTPASASRSEEQAFQVFWEAWKLLQDKYYGELPDPDKMTRAALRGVLGTLDDKNTALIDPEISKILNEDSSGSFDGIGATIRQNTDNLIEVAGLFAGQPAEKSGVKVGDVIMAVDGRSIAGFSTYEAVALIRGPAGTTIKLTIARKGEAKPLEISVTRAKINIPVVTSKTLDGNIAYVSLFDFGATATDQLTKALQQALDKKPAGLILDLRSNPGGLLQQAIQVADLFLDSGIVASEKDRDGNGQTFRSGPRGVAQDIPLVVLVDGSSASAAEIVAGALQDRGRAKLIGVATFGKGSVQLPHKLSDGSELRVTIARWFTPNNRQIHGVGLTPDIEVKMTEEDVKAGRDPQLDRAVQYLINGK